MVTGSLFERNGKYTAVLNTYENGKRKQESFSLGIPVKGNKRKALDILEELYGGLLQRGRNDGAL